MNAIRSTLLFAFALALALWPHRAAQAQPSARHALLVGVTDYQPDAYDNSNRTRKKLRNLVTPCTDIERIGTQLEVLGWKPAGDADAEVEPLCNATDDAIGGRIKELIDEYDDPTKFLFIYLAGHGAQIGDRNYIFGQEAVLNLEQAERRLAQSPSNILFQGQAIELVADLFARANYSEFKGNILLVLDSCRDDPLYSSIRTGTHATLTAPLIAADSAGIMVLYATTPGQRISDGAGTSFMVDSLVQKLQAGATVDRIVGDVRRDVREKTRDTLNQQKPERVGSLNDSSLCFAGCAEVHAAHPPAAPPTALALAWPHPPRWRASPDFDQEPGVPVRAQAMVEPLKTAQVERVFAQALPEAQVDAQVQPLRVDVYWCDAADGGGKQRAEAFARRLRDDGGSQAVGGALLTEVTLRPLGRDDNARAQYALDEDVVRFDADSATERAWARRMGSLAQEPLSLRGDRSNSFGSVSTYFCAGSDVAPRAGKLWIQVADAGQRGIGLVLGDLIRRNVDSLWVENDIEVVATSPASTQVRYFHEQDRELAERIAAAAALRLTARPVVTYLPKYASGVDPGKLELWIGRSVTAEGLMDSAE